jgi:predicted SAM-dependent methyltransferase
VFDVQFVGGGRVLETQQVFAVKLLRKLAGALGYDVRRRQAPPSDMPVYSRLYSRDAIENRRFYNIGAGSFRHPAWTNVDHPSSWYEDAQATNLDLKWDALANEPLPIESGTAEVLYTSHTIEHITDAAANNLFREARRVLKPGGIFRLTMPDIDLGHAAWRRNDRDYFNWIDRYSSPGDYQRISLRQPMNQASTSQVFLWHFASAASTLHVDGGPQRIDDAELQRLFDTLPYEQALSACTAKCPVEVQQRHPGNHINWWNADKLGRLLREAGFTDVYRSGYAQSRCPILRNTRFFDSTRPNVSLYMEAC